ncbi:uncharacterized protein METZ01_LOCUS223700 [marine metagenome]|uniref:Uncharacterized protein n=1 Tax=marine metagenome TaxID=408172 RepID=A0A382G6D4_9ZZZZ
MRILYQKLVRDLSSHTDDHGDDVLSVFYDLNCNPITFDFAYFLVGAEVFAKQNGKSKLFIWFVQKNKDFIKDEEYLKHVDEDSQNWRFNNILLPIACMHAAYTGFGILPQGTSVNKYIKEDLIYPEGFGENYSPRFNYKDLKDSMELSSFRGLQTSLQGQKYINSWKNHAEIDLPIVSITLRNYGFDPSRNSNVKEWVKFADWVSQRGYTPVFIPDVDACWEPDDALGSHLVFTDACWNLEIRMAFYNSCFVSFFYSNGVGSLAMLNKNIRCIAMNPIIEDSLWAYGDRDTHYGLKPDQRRYDFAEPFQWFSWKRDSFENIKSEFLEFEKQFSDELSQEQNAD